MIHYIYKFLIHFWQSQYLTTAEGDVGMSCLKLKLLDDTLKIGIPLF